MRLNRCVVSTKSKACAPVWLALWRQTCTCSASRLESLNGRTCNLGKIKLALANGNRQRRRQRSSIQTWSSSLEMVRTTKSSHQIIILSNDIFLGPKNISNHFKSNVFDVIQKQPHLTNSSPSFFVHRPLLMPFNPSTEKIRWNRSNACVDQRNFFQ